MKSPSTSTFSDSHNEKGKNASVGASLRIDKLTLLIDMPAQLAEGMLQYLYGLAGDKEAMAMYGLMRPYGQKIQGGYKLNLAGRVPATGPAGGWTPKNGFIAQFVPKNETGPLVRLDINPLCLNPHGFEHLRTIVTKVFQIDWPWVQLAHASRVDAALDLDGCCPRDWAWDLPKRRSRQFFVNDGDLHSIYLGSKYGNPMVVYDKANHLGLDPNVERTRVEFRNTKSFPVKDLRDLACPFEQLLVFDPRVIKNAIEPLRRAILPVAHQGGMKGVLELYPENICQWRPYSPQIGRLKIPHFGVSAFS